jgi:hypothetical protein
MRGWRGSALVVGGLAVGEADCDEGVEGADLAAGAGGVVVCARAAGTPLLSVNSVPANKSAAWRITVLG